MRYLVVIGLLFAGSCAFAQDKSSAQKISGETKPDSVGLVWAVHAFHKALVTKDTVELDHLTKDNLHYYHSNGWMQLKRDVIDDLFNGKLTYKQINAIPERMRIDGNIGQARMTADVDVLMSGKPIQLKLKIVQVWIWKDGMWQMLARHSEKV